MEGGVVSLAVVAAKDEDLCVRKMCVCWEGEGVSGWMENCLRVAGLCMCNLYMLSTKSFIHVCMCVEPSAFPYLIPDQGARMILQRGHIRNRFWFDPSQHCLWWSEL